MMSKTISKITKVDNQDVYDVSVADYENYILDSGIITHNSGLKYAADYVLFLSRKKEKDGTEIVGHIIHCLNKKSRLTKENMMVDVLLRYDTGLHRYYGLIELAVEAGVFKKVSTKIEFPDGTTAFNKAILKNPEKYFTQDILTSIDNLCKEKFTYGNHKHEEVVEDEVE